MGFSPAYELYLRHRAMETANPSSDIKRRITFSERWLPSAASSAYIRLYT